MTRRFLASSVTSYKREIKIRYGKYFIVDYFLENMTTIIILNYPLIQCQTFFFSKFSCYYDETLNSLTFNYDLKCHTCVNYSSIQTLRLYFYF